MTAPHFKLVRELERDIRNQVRINQMLRLNRRQRLMITVRRFPVLFAFALVMLLWIFACLTLVQAEEMRAPQCPVPGEKCKVVYLNAAEENLLTGQNGIFDTAAQARNLDLGQFAVYMKTKIAGAREGDMKPVEKPVTQEGTAPKNPEIPADKK